MFKIPLPELKEKIISSGKLSSEELDEKIRAKINELSGLISEEGASHIIANELNIELVDKNASKLKIKEIYAGMRGITTVGKITRKFESREFTKGDSIGKVCSLILGDETGTVRVVFWNEQVDLIKDVKEDEIILIEDAYVRENNNNREIHLGRSGHIEINPEGVIIENVRKGTSYSRKSIADLQSGEEGAEILATVVQVFDPRFFTVHPETGRRLREGEEEGVTPALSYVLNTVLDDGSGNIRAVFWKNQTLHLLNKKEEEMIQFKDDPSSFEDIKTDLLGEQFKIMGRVKNNEMFDRLEFNVQLVEKAKPEEELKKVEEATEPST
jgi:hypothetical protein